jgi:signal transduction histidine kinase
MYKAPLTILKNNEGLSIAFALIVFASLFSTFGVLQQLSDLEITLLIIFSVCYITIGVYGYRRCAGANTLVRIGYFLVQIILGSFVVLLEKGSGYNALALLPLVSHSVLLLTESWAYGVNVLIFFAYLTIGQISGGGVSGLWVGAPSFFATQILVFMFTELAVEEENARIEVEKIASELSGANESLKEYAKQVEELTLTKERNRLAREIHDGLGHSLTTIHMQIKAARAILDKDPGKASETLGLAQELTKEALTDVRDSVSTLRLAAGEEEPLSVKIDKLVKYSQVTGMEVTFVTSGTPRALKPQIEWTLFRACQEGVNNAIKHSNASKVSVSLDYRKKSWVDLVIQDNGKGIVTSDSGFGLRSLKERVQLVNGRLEIITSQGSGVQLHIEVPG